MTLPIPAIDLREGKVVRLFKGDYAQQTTFAFEPEALAAHYADEGASWLHVVDLDGARTGRFENLSTLAGIASSGRLRVQAGGGVRDEDGVRRLIDAGVQRVVVGSIAMRDPETVAAWIGRYGAERIVLALDTRFRDGLWKLPSAGWTADEERTLDDLVPWYRAAGARHLLCTDIDRDGTMTGPNLALYRHLATLAPGMDVQASGGVRSLEDIATLALQDVSGVILGRALLEGAFALSDAFVTAEKANASC
ncbi:MULTISPECIES: 1-(5-phosphoribosyl)-5-[(5-phosphoribosylamino)methylideneamino]imidazole-4-carboxamide isomerase [unclassified Luteibacter]|uniref:1-(5-phosphoribosyl)-5-[(5- phosphoribosylamino)methylideneamino]imidazole-4- carboxamide isomerase n=1 Tax=unclassified Luteibacter TaxID=2620188 RepID=UPI0009A70F08|nr:MULTISPECIES: 1-(5-phosphoribosyl)-5-[(5-phosphoribosylamino)methylideneamino]imidazole-4-carboxamide isomerase [unclassified Luteibacter]MDR6644102.1 phosphoribosylformimino-5-aminoimidazole carboxamide ribotide isomerase [Luteibacter sp. 1214]SKC05355.1 1-(5-phosphoribosyl)-5-[(5-phosphoribosylamino)methylideneamino] imidazole-4-carboxamide isomerase [Luteibacter sp. 22Crub2.1]